VNSLSELEGIENANAQIGDVGGITCHQCHAMVFGGRCQKAIDNRQRAPGVEPLVTARSTGKMRSLKALSTARSQSSIALA
jgi:hypothetical protein